METKLSYTGYLGDLPFEMEEIELPLFPDLELSILETGAVGDGITDNTEAINSAISKIAEQGGGKVVIPAGIWCSGPITLRSNVNLFADDNAIIIFDPDPQRYPIIATSFEGLNTRRCTSPLNAFQAENVAVTGKGIFDGSGEYWTFVKQSKVTASHWESLLSSGGVLNDAGDIWFPSQESLDGYLISDGFNNPVGLETDEEWEAVRHWLRPVFVSIRECENVWIDGVTFRNSPCWTLHPLSCENVVITDVRIFNPEYFQNSDAMDLESCNKVLIASCLMNVGDDGICIKSGKDADGRDRGEPCQNVVIRNNMVLNAHGGFVVGSEMSGGVNNIYVADCAFAGTDIGLRFKSARGRGGVVENIWIERINMTDIATDVITIDLSYTGSAPTYEDAEYPLYMDLYDDETIPEVTEETPEFREIHIRDIKCKDAARVVYLNGLPELRINNISMNDMIITAQSGGIITNADDITMDNVTIVVNESPLFTLTNANRIIINGVLYLQVGEEPVEIYETKETIPFSQRMVETVALKRFLSNQKEETLATAEWDYVPGLVAYSVLNTWIQYPEKTAYYDTVKSYADNNLLENDTVEVGDSNLDDLAAGKIFFKLYLSELEKGNVVDARRYKNCATFLRDKLKYEHSRIDTSMPGTGGFWHKAQYPNQMWLDGLYMGAAFYAGWQAAFGEELGTTDNEDSWNDIVLQFVTVHTYTYDTDKKLNYHAWSADTSDDNAFWARQSDPFKGTSPEFWGRGMGWYFAALVDVLEVMPQEHAGYSVLCGIVAEVADGLALYQDEKTGLWFQLLQYDETVSSDGMGDVVGDSVYNVCTKPNYPESSASAMFTYAYLKGMRIGALDSGLYRNIALKAYNGLLDNFISEDENSGLIIGSSCASAGLGPASDPSRTGTINYYLCGRDVMITQNEGKAIGPFILASLEFEQMHGSQINEDYLFLSPSNGSENVYVDTYLDIALDSLPVLGTQGSIVIYKKDGVKVDEIKMEDSHVGNNGLYNSTKVDLIGLPSSANDNRVRTANYYPVTILGNTVRIKPHYGVLEYDTEYYVTIDKDVIIGNNFGGIPGDEWIFKTRPEAPALTIETITVGKSEESDFRTIQAAIDHAAKMEKDASITVYVENGIYEELLFVRNKNNLTIRGESHEGVIIRYENYEALNGGVGASAARPEFGVDHITSGGRSIFLIEASDNLRLENLTMENTHIKTGNGDQAEVFYFNATTNTLVVINCNLISKQDTINVKGYCWFYNNMIAGDVDFIWGSPVVALFEECEIRSVSGGGYILQARVPGETDNGFVFLNCMLTAGDNVPDGTTYLARSAHYDSYYDNIAFISTKMGSHITSIGWMVEPGKSPNPSVASANSGWKEYASTDLNGILLDVSERLLKVQHQLTGEEYKFGYQDREQIMEAYTVNVGENLDWMVLP